MKTWDVSFPDPRVRACFFGVLNVSVTVPEHIENRRACMAHLGDKDFQLITPYQYHSNVSLYTKLKLEEPPKGDALVTDQPCLAVGVVTADCAPLLFAGQKPDGAPVIGACHAGARGALKGVIQNTLQTMREQGAQGITAWLGPCIHAVSYEVGAEFYDEFTKTDPRTEGCFIRENGQFWFDLPAYVDLILKAENVEYQALRIDTYASEADCFSYRRATHRGEPDYGRQLSAILISA